MKKLYALTLSLMLVLGVLTACGADTGAGTDANAGSGVTDGDGLGGTNGTDNGTDNGLGGVTDTPGSAADTNGDGLPETGGLTGGTADTDGDGFVDGTDGTLVPDPATGSVTSAVTGTAARARAARLVRGASYEQMLRNADVHDTDGDLRDYENAVTPGTMR